ncbi:hypothetical protein Ana3638_11800 [Anaerocolumna sedimenticola]|uniref:Uncharacterized protein n=1 Tax=Anaerocolumna sedimenticola TaxID=2696063 RepID=A0A6P1TMJ5_9FIRM|nr:hypothetical protein [Anaerocolumna sedimenticola]QHQ61372.1 hypothetical protein Ana3638_11800 [Anaerocolumna sedimenticola]
MNDVKSTFSNTYKLYKDNLNNSLFWAIIGNIKSETPAKVVQITTDTYNFYAKWDKAKEQEEFDWGQMRTESIELTHKYNDSDLCRKVLAELMNIIEQEFKPRR